MTAAEVKQAAWVDALGVCCTAVAAGVDTFNLRLCPVIEFAERRHRVAVRHVQRESYWPDLSELMLLWLTTPISTACVERDFSYMTQMDSNTRRRRTNEPGFRADFMAHLHSGWLRGTLAQAVRC